VDSEFEDSLSQSFVDVFRAVHGCTPEICLWNFDHIYHTVGDTSTSGLGGHLAIIYLLSVVVEITAFDLAMVKSAKAYYSRKRILAVFLLKPLGFLPPSATNSVKVEARYVNFYLE